MNYTSSVYGVPFTVTSHYMRKFYYQKLIFIDKMPFRRLFLSPFRIPFWHMTLEGAECGLRHYLAQL